MTEHRAIDVHQHLWPAAFVAALRARTQPPYLAGWTLYLDGEPPYAVTATDHDPQLRADLDAQLSRAIVSLSSPLGIEYLPPEQAAPLLAAWHDGVRALPAPFAGWASCSSVEPDLDQLATLLADGFLGIQLPATDLGTPSAVERLAPVLAVAEAADRPVFVHPGPARGGGDAVPGWWPATVDYVGQLHAAWWAWQQAGRTLFPGLRICFAAGAGLAPVHHERYGMRGGSCLRLDPLTFVDTSSYGPQGLDALTRVLGIDALVLGSDRPYATPSEPNLGAAAAHAVAVTNPLHLLDGVRP